ncbi:MAG: sulfurtransferase TusA family protein [Thermoplasmata archaeon]
MTAPAVAVTIDGTQLTCKGAIARLEEKFSNLPPGGVARVVVNEVPNRIDVRAWADRKGHRIVQDLRRDGSFEVLIAKRERPSDLPASGAVISSP